MRHKKLKIFITLFVVVIAAGAVIWRLNQKKVNGEVIKEVSPFIGSIKTFISSTGTVLPKNRLEVKPPVNGRIERILVKEGDEVKAGQILAWMSSTERAALLDAARGKGDEVYKYWEEAYKPIPMPAPIDGQVIVAKTQPGSTVTTADAVVVLSDHLIVRAQVDETDIGKITLDKKANVTLDAYPDVIIKSTVEHIYYESQTVNNVTIYEVDLAPQQIPIFFRSGMNATVDFIEQDKENVLLIPAEAINKDNKESYVLLMQGNGKDPLRSRVKLGVSDDKNVEVLSGVTQNDRIMVRSKQYKLPQNSTGKNPFMPGRRR
ncbi:MAG: efflux RND transporter periplasmic adaptor subunit [Candidatus Omnitrophota bacterium]|jgi:macrolide-specific efflux system membrane fusion protein